MDMGREPGTKWKAYYPNLTEESYKTIKSGWARDKESRKSNKSLVGSNSNLKRM